MTNHEKARDRLSKANPIVIKIGTSSLTKDGKLDFEAFKRFGLQIETLRKMQKNIALVTSGAVAAGKAKMGWPGEKKLTTDEKRAVAAIGQNSLMQMWRTHVSCVVAQGLATESDLADDIKINNFRTTITQLLSWDVLPILNENDFVSVRGYEYPINGNGIAFSDNDMLASHIASVIGAEALIILSTIKDGLEAKGGKTIRYIRKFDEGLLRFDRGDLTLGGTGGAKTKFLSAQNATKNRALTVVAGSRIDNVLVKICSGKAIGTLFDINPIALQFGG